MSYRPNAFPPHVELLREDCVELTVRKRSFRVRSLEEIQVLLDVLKVERFVGFVLIHIGPGGTPQSVECEQKLRAEGTVW